MLQAASADTKKATARGNSQLPAAPGTLQAPPVPALNNRAELRLMRKCDCGGPDCDCAMGNDKKKMEKDTPRTALHRKPSGSGPMPAPGLLDAETQSFFEARLQRKEPRPAASPGSSPSLQIGAIDDPLEYEADQIAHRVMRMPIGAAKPMQQMPPTGPGTPLQRKPASLGSQTEAPPIVHEVLRSPGQTLDAQTRSFFESRFSRDFSDVRIHTDSHAAQSARSVNALAYTVGSHIAFGQGLYKPRTSSGDALLAHELTHVVQHGSAPVSRSLPAADHSAPSEIEAEAIAHNRTAPAVTVGPVSLARASVKIGNISATVDYGDLINIPATGFAAAIQARYQRYTGAVLDRVVVNQIAAFTASQQEWVLFGLDVLAENAAQAPKLDRTKAFQRLVNRAPISTTHSLGTADVAFEREVLITTGWAEEVVTKGLAAPTPKDLSVIDPLLNPPPAANAPPGGAFDSVTFNAELPGLTLATLKGARQNTAKWGGILPQALSQVQSIGDVIQDQARSFFTPFSETARDNRWLAGWRYSSQISSVTTDPVGNPRVISQDERLSLLKNRATVAGQDSSKGASLFSRTNFQPDRDGAVLQSVIAALEADPAVQPLIDDLARHTGHANTLTHEVAVSTEIPANRPECDTRWQTIRTLCHELMHALMHPDFLAATHGSPRFPTGVPFDQALIEGFAEVLSVQLFSHLRDAVPADPALLHQLTQGIPGACTPPTKAVKPGYGDAGANAEVIRSLVGDQRFRAAFFSGKVSLIGL